MSEPLDNFNQLPGATEGKPVSDVGFGQTFNTLAEQTGMVSDMATFNMGKITDFRGVRGCRNGLRLTVGSDDHGNPHVEVWGGGNTPLAKIFIEPQVAFDPSRNSYLSPQEKEAVFRYLSVKENLNKCKEEWNRVHKTNTSAQPATVPQTTQGQ